MKRQKFPIIKPLALVVTGVFLGRGAHATTEITFGSFSADNVDLSTLVGYGSNVGASSSDYNVSVGATGILGTPGIGLTWGTGYQTYTAWDGRGNVAQTDYNLASPIDLIFTPTADSGVLVSSFVLDEWAGGGDASVSWSLFDSVGTLASGIWNSRNTANDPADAGGRDTILTGLTAANINVGLPVTLRLTHNSGLVSYLALDNLTFDQVPEPGVVSLGLLGVGLGAMAMRRRKQP
jgi:hypothetical protein